MPTVLPLNLDSTLAPGAAATPLTMPQPTALTGTTSQAAPAAPSPTAANVPVPQTPMSSPTNTYAYGNGYNPSLLGAQSMYGEGR